MSCNVTADRSSSDARAVARARGLAKLQYGLITHLRACSPPSGSQSVCKNALWRPQCSNAYLEMMASEPGVSYSDNYASASGSSGYGGEECCPLVVDLICLAAILASIAGASVLLARVIQIEIMTNGRRKRSLLSETYFLEGKHAFAAQCIVPRTQSVVDRVVKSLRAIISCD